ncbi:unnamed protein product [Urochloa decumbens]|uniref:Nucleoside phosphorylase domain-containing protein n=1 Tax=Urochloa decumbens TaxID=240449 RepID=A0ABC8YZC7_9POAL
MAAAGIAISRLAVAVLLVAAAATPAAGFISTKTWRAVRRANRVGAPFVGLVVPNAYEMDPVLKSPSFKPSADIPILDVQAQCRADDAAAVEPVRVRVEMESAAVALVAHQLGVPFITIRSLSDLAGGGSSLSNEAATFLAIAAKNAVDVMLKFVPLLAAGEHAEM